MPARLVLRRLAALPVTLALVALIGFGLVELLPGDALSARGDLATARRLTDGDVARLRTTYGLDLPAFVNTDAEGFGALTETRLGRWIGRLVRFDLGESIEGRAVSTLVGEALPVTLLVGLTALFAAYLVALPLGAFTAAWRHGLLDRAVGGSTLLALSLPAPWVAVGLVSLAAATGDAWPIRGLYSPGAESWSTAARALDVAAHLLLPVVCLAYGTTALLLRYQRGAVLAALAEDFVRTANAMGASPRRVLFRHAFRASLAPTLSLLAVEIPWLLSGSVVVEAVFDLPGVGSLTARALAARDYPTLLGVTMTLALVSVIASVFAEWLAAWADPRLRAHRGRE
jgi:peptide/nickel transport system permease protein